jgi:hypothetical protein
VRNRGNPRASEGPVWALRRRVEVPVFGVPGPTARGVVCAFRARGETLCGLRLVAVIADDGGWPIGLTVPSVRQGAHYARTDRGGGLRTAAGANVVEVPTRSSRFVAASWVRCMCGARGSPRDRGRTALECRSAARRPRRWARRTGPVCLWCAHLAGRWAALPAQPEPTPAHQRSQLALSRPARQGRAQRARSGVLTVAGRRSYAVRLGASRGVIERTGSVDAATRRMEHRDRTSRRWTPSHHVAASSAATSTARTR